MQNLIFKALNGQFKIVATTQYITRIYDSTKNEVQQSHMFLMIAHLKPHWLPLRASVASISIIVHSKRLPRFRFFFVADISNGINVDAKTRPSQAENMRINCIRLSKYFMSM